MHGYKYDIVRNKLYTPDIYAPYFLYLPRRIEFLSNVIERLNLFNSYFLISNHISFALNHSKRRWFRELLASHFSFAAVNAELTVAN